MKILFLDDDKERHARFQRNRIGQNITAVWSYEEAVKALEETVFDIAYLDHDLSDMAASGYPAKGEKTGTDVAKYIAEMSEDRRPKKIVIHSFNYYGRLRMADILKDAGVTKVRIEPFHRDI